MQPDLEFRVKNLTQQLQNYLNCNLNIKANPSFETTVFILLLLLKACILCMYTGIEI